MFNRAALIIFSALLSACSTTNVGLKYSPATAAGKIPDREISVSIGSFIDKREEPGKRLGAILGGYGNPLKTLEADRPVSEMVQAAFSDALIARGITVSNESKSKITGVVTRLDCSQYVRREANVAIEVVVLDQSNQKKFEKTYSASNLDGSLITLDAGIFASVDDLRAVLEKTLRQVIDQAVDEQALLAALK